MADELNDPNKPTKVEAETEAAPVPTPEEEQAQIEEIDAAIHQIDPHFQSQLEKIGPNDEMQKGIVEGFGLEFSGDTPVSNMPMTWRERLKSIPSGILRGIKSFFAGIKEKVSESLRTFKYLPAKQKLSVVVMFALFIGGAFVGYKAATKGLFPPEEELFITSLQEWSQEAYAYENTETEFLYESTHSSKNIMEISRVVVNIRRSASSGSNPMAALEFYAEGTSSDVMVEVKDREAEVKDLLQRNIEEITFDQISSAEGKQLLCEKLRKEVNKILTKGKIRRFYIKTAIVKP